MRYNDKMVREICHAVKERDRAAIVTMADYFINLDIVRSGSVIIPAPQHEGFSVYTKQIAEIVSKETGAFVCDILKCVPHETMYHMKKGRYIRKPVFYLADNIPSGNTFYFLDNVYDIGTTINGANRLFNGTLVPLVYATV